MSNVRAVADEGNAGDVGAGHRRGPFTGALREQGLEALPESVPPTNLEDRFDRHFRVGTEQLEYVELVLPRAGQ